MCIPIFPAVDHPTGPAPLRPEPAFLFKKCYHWSGDDLWLYLYIKYGEFTHEKGEFIHLPGRDAMTMVEVLEDDTDKMEIDVPTQQCTPASDEGLQLEPMTTTVLQDVSDVLNDDGEAPPVVSSPIFPVDDS